MSLQLKKVLEVLKENRGSIVYSLPWRLRAALRSRKKSNSFLLALKLVPLKCSIAAGRSARRPCSAARSRTPSVPCDEMFRRCASIRAASSSTKRTSAVNSCASAIASRSPGPGTAGKVGSGPCGEDRHPSRQTVHPKANRLGCGRLHQFAQYARRHHDSAVKLRQKIDLLYDHEVTYRARIGDDDHRRRY